MPYYKDTKTGKTYSYKKAGTVETNAPSKYTSPSKTLAVTREKEGGGTVTVTAGGKVTERGTEGEMQKSYQTTKQQATGFIQQQSRVVEQAVKQQNELRAWQQKTADEQLANLKEKYAEANIRQQEQAYMERERKREGTARILGDPGWQKFLRKTGIEEDTKGNLTTAYQRETKFQNELKEAHPTEYKVRNFISTKVKEKIEKEKGYYNKLPDTIKTPVRELKEYGMEVASYPGKIYEGVKKDYLGLPFGVREVVATPYRQYREAQKEYEGSFIQKGLQKGETFLSQQKKKFYEFGTADKPLIIRAGTESLGIITGAGEKTLKTVDLVERYPLETGLLVVGGWRFPIVAKTLMAGSVGYSVYQAPKGSKVREGMETLAFVSGAYLLAKGGTKLYRNIKGVKSTQIEDTTGPRKVQAGKTETIQKQPFETDDVKGVAYRRALISKEYGANAPTVTRGEVVAEGMKGNVVSVGKGYTQETIFTKQYRALIIRTPKTTTIKYFKPGTDKLIKSVKFATETPPYLFSETTGKVKIPDYRTISKANLKTRLDLVLTEKTGGVEVFKGLRKTTVNQKSYQVSKSHQFDLSTDYWKRQEIGGTNQIVTIKGSEIIYSKNPTYKPSMATQEFTIEGYLPKQVSLVETVIKQPTLFRFTRASTDVYTKTTTETRLAPIETTSRVFMKMLASKKAELSPATTETQLIKVEFPSPTVLKPTAPTLLGPDTLTRSTYVYAPFNTFKPFYLAETKPIQVKLPITVPYSKSIVLPATETIPETKTEIIPTTKTLTPTKSKTYTQTKTLTETETITETPTTTTITQIFTPLQPTTTQPPLELDFPKPKQPKQKKGGFEIFVRQKKQFKKIAEAETSEQAFFIGRTNVLQTARASFKIRPIGSAQNVMSSPILNNKFYSSKKEPGVFIQKRKYRISTPGEKREIPGKARMINLMQSKRKGIFGGF